MRRRFFSPVDTPRELLIVVYIFTLMWIIVIPSVSKKYWPPPEIPPEWFASISIWLSPPLLAIYCLAVALTIGGMIQLEYYAERIGLAVWQWPRWRVLGLPEWLWTRAMVLACALFCTALTIVWRHDGNWQQIMALSQAQWLAYGVVGMIYTIAIVVYLARNYTVEERYFYELERDLREQDPR